MGQGLSGGGFGLWVLRFGISLRGGIQYWVSRGVYDCRWMQAVPSAAQETEVCIFTIDSGSCLFFNSHDSPPKP